MLGVVCGLRFTCQPGCTSCCSVTGYVYLTEPDLRSAAVFLGITKKAFERRYVYRTRHLLRLRKPRNAQCHFLKDGGCTIHPAKPTQCRLFPFWPELVASRDSWRRARAYCPGIGKGPAVSLDAALRIANRMREAYPGVYRGYLA